MSSEYDVAAAREKVHVVANRMKSDQAYAREVREQPVIKLREAGLDDTTIAIFCHEEGWGDDVSGYALLNVNPSAVSRPGGTPGSSLDMWCVCTGCCVTSIVIKS